MIKLKLFKSNDNNDTKITKIAKITRLVNSTIVRKLIINNGYQSPPSINTTKFMFFILFLLILFKLWEQIFYGN